MISKRLFAIFVFLACVFVPLTCSAQSGMMAMPSSVDLDDPMTREGSGTSWMPDSTPMYGKMIMKPDGQMIMLHGAIMPRYTDVGSKRGDRKADAPNWFMGMYSRPLNSQSQLGAHLMMSLDPLTEGGYGYPLLFQTGETWHGIPLHDRQHPHNFFAEASGVYSHNLGGQGSAYFYLGDPGEPALGPPAYMHRLTALDLPDAPIGHHWQDATHITFGVATAGLAFSEKVKIEASDFTGREPDENRWSFNKPRWDSYSGRISFNPNPDNAFQVSYGFVKNPEGDGANVDRTTASWIFNRPLGEDSNFTTTLVWGQNFLTSEGKSESYLLEGDYQHGVNDWFTRYENIQKSGHELVLPTPYDSAILYDLNALTVGCVHDVSQGKGIDTGLGLAVTVDTKPDALDPFYGHGAPVGFEVYLRLRASRMGVKGSAHMAGMSMPANQSEPTGPTTLPPAVSALTPTPAPTVAQPPTVAAPVTPSPVPSAPKAAAIANALATISPNPPKARSGNMLTVVLTDADGKPVAGAKVTAAVAMTSMDMGTSHPSFKDLGDGRYQAKIVFAMPGPWQVALTIKEGNGKPMAKVVQYDVGR